MKVILKGNIVDGMTFEVEKNSTVEEILKQVEDKLPYPIYACKFDNIYRALTHKITHDCTVEFLDMKNQATWLIYQNSLSLIFIKAIHDVMGKDVQVSIRNSLNKGIYINSTKRIDEETLPKIEKRMREIVEADEPIVKEYFSRKQAMKLAKELNQKETYAILKSRPSLQDVSIYTLMDETQIFYSLMVPSTSYLKYFDLHLFESGVILRFPHQNNPLALSDYREQHLLYDAFKQTTKWGNLMGTKYVSNLNQKIAKNEYKDIILMQEALHENRIVNLSKEIIDKGKRVVLICGPSSSGKTSFANRLIIQLRVNGYKTLYLGTDDYFVNRDQTPIDENGEKDYENIEAVDCDLFVSNLKDLLNKELVDLPKYDFVLGEKIFGERKTKIDDDTIIVIEGIHALNERLTNGIRGSKKFKIYISPFSPISLDRLNRFPTTDARMLRRMVRDHQFRGRSVHQTLRDWPKVRTGEDKNIFPVQEEADVYFNSNCLYELAVLKKYAEPLLKEVTRDQEEYAEAQRMLSYLRFVDTIEDDDIIANNSIIREFIGGSSIVS